MPGSLGRRTAPGGNKSHYDQQQENGVANFEPYNKVRIGNEAHTVITGSFGPGKPKVQAAREPVQNFNFQANPEHLELDLFHQSQLNWLNDQTMAHIMREERSRDFVDQSCGDLKNSIDDLEKWLQKIDKEGNEWKSRYENQQEHNNTTGLAILKLTDTVENIKNQIINNEPPLKKFDEYTPVRWKKMLMHQEKLYAKLSEDLQDIEWRLEQEAKAYYKINRQRNDNSQELNILNHYESKELQALNQSEAQKQEQWRAKREHPQQRRPILEEFGNRPKKGSDDRDFDSKSIASTRFTRSRGRFTPRDSGIGSVSRSTNRRTDSDWGSERGDSVERNPMNGFSQTGGKIQGTRAPMKKKKEDPIDALFSSSQNGLPAGYGYGNNRSNGPSRGPSKVERIDDIGRISRINTQKSALKTNRSSNSGVSERNRVSFVDNSRGVSRSLDSQSMRSGRLPPLENSRNSRNASVPNGRMQQQSHRGSVNYNPNPNTNGIVLTKAQQKEIDQLIQSKQKPVMWRGQ